MINLIQDFTLDHNTWVLNHNMNSFTLKAYNNLYDFFKWYTINMETNFPKDCTTSPSPNSSKRTSVNSTTLSINYVDWVQAQANNMTWAEQVENRESKSFSLSYTTLKYQILQVWSLQLSLYICSRNKLWKCISRFRLFSDSIAGQSTYGPTIVEQ